MSSINDPVETIYRASRSYLIEHGYIYEWDDFINLKSIGGVISYAFTTGDLPVLVDGFRIQSAPDKAMEHCSLDWFSGGAISAGVAVPVYTLNEIDAQQDPYFGDVLAGVTIDTPGTQIYGTHLIGAITREYDRKFERLVLQRNTVYYFTLTNLATVGNNEVMRLSMSAMVIYD